MKNYEKMPYQGYKPDLRVGHLAAEQIKDQLCFETGYQLQVSKLFWDEAQWEYLAIIPDVQNIRTGNIMRIAVIEGRYFMAICQFSTLATYVALSIKEVDYGHYHRYHHFINKIDEVCDDCPDNVSRRAA